MLMIALLNRDGELITTLAGLEQELGSAFTDRDVKW